MEWGDSWHCPSSTVIMDQHLWFPARGQGETGLYGGSLPLALGVWRGAGLGHPPGAVAPAQGSQVTPPVCPQGQTLGLGVSRGIPISCAFSCGAAGGFGKGPAGSDIHLTRHRNKNKPKGEICIFARVYPRL